MGYYFRMSPASHPRVTITSKRPIPEWARLEREIIDKLNSAAPEFVARYTRPDGSLIWHDKWPGMDGSDDPYEGFMYLALFYSIGGSEEVYELAQKMWEAITLQWTQYGQIYREFDGYYDWMHHGEGYLFHYFFGLTKPEYLVDRQRANLFARFYTGEDKEAQNYDPVLKLMRSPLTGSKGPRQVVTKEDWETHRTVLDEYPAPYEDVIKTEFSTMRCQWSDPEIYEDLLSKMNERMNLGDVPLNLNSTSLLTHAYMYSQDESIKQSVIEYITAWIGRCELNNGIIPDNIGTSGQIGEFNEGKWWGGYYGWRWPHGLMTIMEPITNAAMNALLLTGDTKYLELPRSQFDLIWSLRQEDNGEVTIPHRHLDSGWSDYRQPSARHMIYLWTASMAQEDLDRILALPHERDRDQIVIPRVSGKDKKSGRSTKHYIGNTLSWFEFIRGNFPSYPTEILKANLQLIEAQLQKMRSNTGNPHNWSAYDPETSDVEVGLDLRIPGYSIHAWQEFNPIYFEGLSQILSGAPMHISHGGLQFGKIRYFDGQKKRSGLPDDVAAMVERLTADEIRLVIVNLGSTESRVVTIQAGNFGENRFESVLISVEDEKSQTLDIKNKWFTIELSPGAGATLDFMYSRYENKPTYETPYSARSDWYPLD
jgi:hypothetical protein